jgi:PTH1 family peptidyl-tRNA hydrolase
VSETVRVFAGLGNPGPGYAGHRHNVGFWLADALADRFGGHFAEQKKFKAQLAQVSVAGHSLLLVKPLTFMNRSGEAIRPLLHFYRIPSAALLVSHDELDLPPGTLRFKRGGGHGGHNGLRDISRVLGPDYGRMRIGIGHPGSKEKVHGHVLSNPAPEEARVLGESVDRAVDSIASLFGEGWDKAMQKLHTDNAS